MSSGSSRTLPATYIYRILLFYHSIPEGISVSNLSDFDFDLSSHSRSNVKVALDASYMVSY